MEKVRGMTHDTAREFGEYLQSLRRQRKLGIRELARKAAIDSGGITRIEKGQARPRPDTLKCLAIALEVPVSDMFAMAGYVTPSDLPSISTYLRVCYRDLSDESLIHLEGYIRHLIDDRHLDPNGPVAFEDETENPSKN
jgi:transcriptional regulator with XRE-family HTH domain